jgi:hypothetical protein
VLLSSESGLFVYKIEKGSNKLVLAQSFKTEKELYFTDMQFEAATQMLYLLGTTQPLIKVYHFAPSQFPKPDKSLTVFVEYDLIDFSAVTNRHNEDQEEKNIHLRLEISHEREQQTLMILFLHRYHYVVAELSYNVNTQSWYFVRYFKFSMIVH